MQMFVLLFLLLQSLGELLYCFKKKSGKIFLNVISRPTPTPPSLAFSFILDLHSSNGMGPEDRENLF